MYKKGVSLLESLLVLGILAVILGSIMVFLSYANNRAKVNQTQMELMELVNIVHQYANSNENIDNDFIIKSNTLPQKYIKNNNLVSAFGTNISVNASGKNFNIQVDNISKSNCILFATQDYGNSIASISVNNNIHIQMDGILSLNQAEQLCNTNTNSFALTSDKE